MGVISAGIERATSGNQYTDKMVIPSHGSTTAQPQPKTQVLADAGIDIRRANEAEKLAALDNDVEPGTFCLT